MASIRKRTNKDGSTSYRVDVRLKGFPPQRATFQRLTDARKWGQHTEASIREGRYFKTAEARKHTFADLAERYIKDALPRKSQSAKKIQTAQMEWWKVHLGHHVLSDVTPALITECRDRLLGGTTKQGKPRSPATVVRYMAALSHAFTVAVNEWGWLEDSPMRKVKKPQESRGRVRFLSDDEKAPNGSAIEGERTRLLKACAASENPYLYIAVVLCLSTGMRSGEIMNLHWSQPAQVREGQTWGLVLLDQKAIILHNTKNKDTRRVPLLGKAHELLRAHARVRRIDTTLLFPGKVKTDKPMDLRAPWQAALKEAGIKDFRFHDLRHSAASYLAMNGASLAEIAEVLGHKTLQMVKRYAHLSEAHTAGVVERMNNRIFGEGA